MIELLLSLLMFEVEDRIEAYVGGASHVSTCMSSTYEKSKPLLSFRRQDDFNISKSTLTVFDNFSTGL